MKKTINARKLSLTSETVRSLVADQLALVAGGRAADPDPWSGNWLCPSMWCVPKEPDSVNVGCPNTPNL